MLIIGTETPRLREAGRVFPGVGGEIVALCPLQGMSAHDPIQASRQVNVYDARMEGMQTGSVNARLDALGEKIDLLSEAIDRRFEQVDQRFEQVDKRFEQVDRRFEQVDRRLEKLEDRYHRMQLTLLAGALGIIATLIGFN